MIIDAVAPLLMEFGPAATSRQIAEAAGIAEGTIYRAFSDKEELLRAAVEKHMDPAPLLRALERIDPGLPLRSKILLAVTLMRERFRRIFGLMALFGDYRKRPSPETREAVNRVFSDLLAPDLAVLSVDPQRVAGIIQGITFSASLPQLNDGVAYSPDELTDIVLYGIAGTRPPTTVNDF